MRCGEEGGEEKEYVTTGEVSKELWPESFSGLVGVYAFSFIRRSCFFVRFVPPRDRVRAAAAGVGAFVDSNSSSRHRCLSLLLHCFLVFRFSCCLLGSLLLFGEICAAHIDHAF